MTFGTAVQNRQKAANCHYRGQSKEREKKWELQAKLVGSRGTLEGITSSQ